MVGPRLKKLIYPIRPFYLSMSGIERSTAPPKVFAPKLYAAYIDKSDVVAEVGA